MQRIFVTACAALSLVMFGAAPVAANERTKTTDISAQARKKPRTTLTIRPRSYPYRTYSSPYPSPYAVEYPGPNAVRQCVARYVEEHRPSGTVIVPRVRCWWERG
jgi:hypothetical protein